MQGCEDAWRANLEDLNAEEGWRKRVVLRGESYHACCNFRM